jgi:hypothetical protein
MSGPSLHSYNMPTLLHPPSYLFPWSLVGLIQMAVIIGFILPMFVGGYVPGIITARQNIRNHRHVVVEQRLVWLLPLEVVSLWLVSSKASLPSTAPMV